MHTRRRAFRAVNGGLVLMRSWSVNIVRFCGIVAKRSVVNRTKDYLQINIKAPPNVDPASTTKKVITLSCVHHKQIFISFQIYSDLNKHLKKEILGIEQCF